MKINTTNAKLLSLLLEKEHPQTVAVIISLLDEALSIEVMKLLSEHIKRYVLQRLEKLEFASVDNIQIVINTINEELIEPPVRRIGAKSRLDKFKSVPEILQVGLKKEPMKRLTQKEIDEIIDAIRE